MEAEPDTTNLVYIDEFSSERWLLKLQVARESGQLAIFNADFKHPGQLLLFPEQPTPPDTAA